MVVASLAPGVVLAQCDVTDGMLIELQSTTAIDGLLRGSSGCVVGTTVDAPLTFSGGVLTLGQNGATTGQVLSWNGSAWVATTALISVTENEIVFGDASNLPTSSPDFTYDGSTLFVNRFGQFEGGNASVSVVDNNASNSSGGGALYLSSFDNAALASGDRIGLISFIGSKAVGGTGSGVQAESYADGTWSSTSSPGRFTISTTPATTTTPVQRITVKESGNIEFYSAKDFRFYDADNSNYIGWKSPSTLTADRVIEWPSDSPSDGEVLTYHTGSITSWDAPTVGTVDLTADVTGVLPAANGGTGNASYTTGDILYASGTTTLSKLADVATGNAIISGGVGVAPSYGKIGLTTHVSGTLPVTSGGTGLTSATQGDIVYASAANTYSLLAKNTTATRYLSNTGTSNNPAWAQVALSTGVSGTLPVANGGTGLTTLTANRIPYGNGTSAFQSSGNLTFDGTTISVTGKASLNFGGSYSSGQNFFSASGTVTGTSNSADYNGFYFAPVFANDGTVTSNSLAGLRFSQSSSGSTAGISYNMVTGNTNTSPNVSQLYGIFSRLDENTTSGNLSTRIVGRFQCYKNSDAFDAHSGTGLQVDLAENSSSGRWNNGSGLVMSVNNAITLRGANTTMAHSKGTGNTQYGYQMTNNVSGSGVTVSNVYGLHLSSTASSGGVITNYYGVYQNSIPTGGTLAYFLYNNNNARSYTNGSLAIGTDATTSKLLVRGSGTTSSTYSGIFEKSDGTDVLVIRDDGKVAIANDGFNEALNINGQARADAYDIRSWETTDNTNDGELHYEDGDGQTAYLTIGAGERRFPILPHMVQLQAIDYNVDWTTGRTKAFWTVPARFNGWKVSKVYVSVSSIGSVTGNVVEIEKGGVGITTQTISSASHTVTIDNSIATDDIFTFDITSVGATASKGLFVEIELRHN